MSHHALQIATGMGAAFVYALVGIAAAIRGEEGFSVVFSMVAVVFVAVGMFAA